MAKCHGAQIERAKAGPTPGRPGRRRQVPPLPLSARPVVPGRRPRHRNAASRFVSGLAGNRSAHPSARPGPASPHLGLAGPPRPRAPLGLAVRGRSRPQVRASPGPAAWPGDGDVPPGHGVAGVRAPSAPPRPRAPLGDPRRSFRRAWAPSHPPAPGGGSRGRRADTHLSTSWSCSALNLPSSICSLARSRAARPLQLRKGFRCTSWRTRRRPGLRQTFPSRRRDGAAAHLPPPLPSPPLPSPPLPPRLRVLRRPSAQESQKPGL
ncbi:unnamed protein product [Nyctereutes procyonoides]|uniref:(raccoon dog) hypothetical protein n=1 Tax=Nyctereutes procyonoides TaxID=34880 RepID=A0A811ZGW3_NYCPR|nr:unnamed protein product [Nyctereutes procyonoides]